MVRQAVRKAPFRKSAMPSPQVKTDVPTARVGGVKIVNRDKSRVATDFQIALTRPPE
jgi:hypothetical protein